MAMRLVYGFGELISEERPGGPQFIIGDQVGSPVIVSDLQGQVVGRSKNLPFGERLSSWGEKSTRRFTNHEDQPGSAIVTIHPLLHSRRNPWMGQE